MKETSKETMTSRAMVTRVQMCRCASIALVAAGLLGIGAMAGCGDDAERVADKFVDYYFVELDQARARPLTIGLAERKLDEELRLVEGVRRQVDPGSARPRGSWQRRPGRIDDRRGHFVYHLTMRHGSDETTRDLLVSIERRDDKWRVANFTLLDPVTARPSAPKPGASPAATPTPTATPTSPTPTPGPTPTPMPSSTPTPTNAAPPAR